jgi:hypothetical protein
VRRKIILAFCLLVPLTCLGEQASLTPSDKADLKRLAPELEITPELVEVMKELVYSRQLPVQERMEAVARLSGVNELPPDQRMQRTICIWDIAGRNGPIFSAAMEQRARALELGVNLDMRPFTNEGVLVEELKAGHCDAALMSGMRAKTFNTFTGTVDAIGAVPTRQHMRTLLEVLAHPKTAGKMVQGEYVILGVFPGGGAYVFVNDKRINSLAKAAGQKVAVLDYDPMQSKMIAGVGATPVATDITRAPGMFNNGVVDILAAPLVAYEVLELYKGMTPDGGIIDYPLAQISMQLVGRRDRFPDQIAQLIREATLQRYDEIMRFIEQEQGKVPDKWWIEIEGRDKAEYETMMQAARVELRDQGYYDPRMLTLQRKIRCKFDASRSECANPVE